VIQLVLYGFLAAVAAIVLFGLFVFVLPKGEQMAPAVPDSAPWALPDDQPISADDIATLRLPVGLRGYRFAEADILLDRLADELRRRDAEIAWLRSGRIGPDPSLVPRAADNRPERPIDSSSESSPGEHAVERSDEQSGDGTSQLQPASKSLWPSERPVPGIDVDDVDG
jgi:hypothetical protein